MLAEGPPLSLLDALARRPRLSGEIGRERFQLAASAGRQRRLQPLLEFRGLQAPVRIRPPQPDRRLVAVAVGCADLRAGYTLYRAHCKEKVLSAAVELDRNFIERRDFAPARRGYDPDEVDQHLRSIAQAVDRLQQGSQSQATVSGAAASRVQSIVEAAERSANEIESQAQAEADRLRAEAEEIVQAARADADQQAVEHVERAETAAGSIVERSQRLETEVDQLLDQLSTAARTVIDNLRGGADNLRTELEDMRRELGTVRAARPQTAGGGGAAALQQQSSIADQPTEQFTPPELRDEEPLPVPPSEPEPEPAGPPDAEPEVVEEAAAPQPAAAESPAATPAGPPPVSPAAAANRANEGARLIALNMALSGTPREETARYLADNFDLADQEDLLDEVYARAGG